jgi:AcrR family transcriptional regulator
VARETSSTSSKKKKAAPPPPRRRRDPETARAEILDAAEQVLAERPPHAVGLKEIAAAAGVSHALLSHYFGTYDDLIEAALERRVRRLREAMILRLRDHGAELSSGELLSGLFAMLEDPVYVRLSLWAFAAERPSGKISFPLREQGMRIFAEALTERILRDRPDLEPGPLRERVELALVTANSAAYGYVVGKEAWVGALGRAPSAAFDQAFREALEAMVETYVLGPSIPGSLRSAAHERKT